MVLIPIVFLSVLSILLFVAMDGLKAKYKDLTTELDDLKILHTTKTNTWNNEILAQDVELQSLRKQVQDLTLERDNAYACLELVLS